jgi:hypothetical protein
MDDPCHAQLVSQVVWAGMHDSHARTTTTTAANTTQRSWGDIGN